MSHIFAKLFPEAFPIEKIAGSSILVTGGNGLIGSNCIELLTYLNQSRNLHMSITAMCRNREKAEARLGGESGLRLLVQDVTAGLDPSSEYDFIIHTAGLAHPLAYAKRPVEVMKTNFSGTMALLDYCTQRKARLLYVSSGEVYGENNGGRPFFETDAGTVDFNLPRACYSESKRAAETLCVSYHVQYGTDVVMARPGYIYGPGITQDNSRADAQFLRNVLGHDDIVMKSSGEQRRSYCHVYDCCSALLYILLLGESGSPYNIANKDSVATIREYAQTLADCGNVKLRFEIPDRVEARGYSKAKESILCADKLEALGWRPVFGLREGLKETLQRLENSREER